MKTLKVFQTTEFKMLGEFFSILENEKGLYTLAIDNEYSQDFFFDKDGLFRFAKRNVKNLSDELQTEILNYIQSI
jgi:hypothetical protein